MNDELKHTKRLVTRSYMTCGNKSLESIVVECTNLGLDLSQLYLEIEESTYNEVSVIRVKGTSLETDRELTDRVRREQNAALREEEHERKLLAYLKQKYETTTKGAE